MEKMGKTAFGFIRWSFGAMFCESTCLAVCQFTLLLDANQGRSEMNASRCTFMHNDARDEGGAIYTQVSLCTTYAVGNDPKTCFL